MDSNAQPSLSQTQSPSKYDGAVRLSQRMDELRKHHNESSDIHDRTQPIIDEQIHEETMKYLKSGQVNGTKSKNQKPRVPKRQRNTTNPVVNQQTNPVVSSTTNGLPPQPHIQQQATPVPPSSQVTAPQHSLTYPPRIQQHPMHIQQPQHHYGQQRFIYQQSQQPSMQNQIKQPQQMYPQQQQIQISSSHVDPQYVAQHYTSHHSLQHHHNHNHHHHLHHNQNHYTHPPFTSLPNDLDLTLQAGLECDVDSLIKHEMSVEGQLEFNHDLLQRILF